MRTRHEQEGIFRTAHGGAGRGRWVTNGGLRRRHDDMLRDQEAWFRALRDEAAADGPGAVALHGPGAPDPSGRKCGTRDGDGMWWDRATAMLAGVMRAVAHMREHGDRG